MALFASAWRPRLERRRSRCAGGLALALFLLALCALAVAALDTPMTALAVLAWALLAVREWRHWRQGEEVRVVEERRSDWWLVFRDGRAGGMRLQQAMVWRWLVVLDFERPEGGRPDLPRRQRVVFWPDSVDAEDFRRLRVRLALGPAPGQPLRD